MTDSYVGRDVAGQFRILQKIGAGGMGAVYKAEQPDMNRHVAIKILTRVTSRGQTSCRVSAAKRGR